MKSIISQSGIKVKTSADFYEGYDSSLDIRKYGSDNLYPQALRRFYETSKSFSACADRMQSFLFGLGTPSTIISNKVLSLILRDYTIYGGFALHIQYNGLGDITGINYIPFETIRLGEQGTNGLYTYCYYSPDWSNQKTINKKKIESKKNKIKYWMFTPSIETRLNRIVNAEGEYAGEVLYFSNTISYPREIVRSVITDISAEVGISNILYRDVRSSFMPSSVLAVPRQSDEDLDELGDNIAALQGDDNAHKILMLSFSTPDDKPEVLNLSGQDYTEKVSKYSELIKASITKAYNQEAFLRLEEGSLGFSTDVISQVYHYYNYQLRNIRSEITSVLRMIDPMFELVENDFE